MMSLKQVGTALLVASAISLSFANGIKLNTRIGSRSRPIVMNINYSTKAKESSPSVTTPLPTMSEADVNVTTTAHGVETEAQEIKPDEEQAEERAEAEAIIADKVDENSAVDSLYTPLTTITKTNQSVQLELKKSFISNLYRRKVFTPAEKNKILFYFYSCVSVIVFCILVLIFFMIDERLEYEKEPDTDIVPKTDQEYQEELEQLKDFKSFSKTLVDSRGIRH